jgi:predicted PurR-regulated permease PerM
LVKSNSKVEEMELFIPGLLLFFCVIVFSFLMIPRFTPLVVAIVSIVVLVFAVQQHYNMFEEEYRLSTWQESFKMYAPAIMIIAIILFIIYSILTLFTKGSVPVPSLPSMPVASPDSITGQLSTTLNKVATSVGNTSSNLLSGVKSVVNRSASPLVNAKVNGMNRPRTNLSRSFFETL